MPPRSRTQTQTDTEQPRVLTGNNFRLAQVDQTIKPRRLNHFQIAFKNSIGTIRYDSVRKNKRQGDRQSQYRAQASAKFARPSKLQAVYLPNVYMLVDIGDYPLTKMPFSSKTNAESRYLLGNYNARTFLH